ncbi:MAG: hypothetical protein NXI09_03425 [Bacteroidetes bacterium]|nr:hypothetical protein [Bacteroidota bacterium]
MFNLRILIFCCLYLIQGNTWGQKNACDLRIVIISEDQDSEWNLPKVVVFQDSFKGPNLNPDLWGFGFPWGKILIPESLEGMAEENLRFEDDAAIIKTEFRPREFDTFVFQDGQLVGTRPVLKDYSSAGIFSRMVFTRGEFELEYEIEALSAQWPAFWLLGDCQQEIDIFEYFYGKSLFHNDWTQEITYTLHQDDNCEDPEKCRLIKTKFLEDGFFHNTLSAKLNWQKYRLEFYRDKLDKPDWIHYRWRDMSYRPLANPSKGSIVRQSRYFPFDKPMRLFIGQGVHYDLQRNLTEPKELKLLNLRVIQAIKPSGKLKFDNTIIDANDYDGIVTGGEVRLSEADYFNKLDYLIIKAAKDITIESGFDTKGARTVELDAITDQEILIDKGNGANDALHLKIISYSVYDAVGKLINENTKVSAEPRDIESLIAEHLKHHDKPGLIIFRFNFNDGSAQSRKIYLL